MRGTLGVSTHAYSVSSPRFAAEHEPVVDLEAQKHRDDRVDNRGNLIASLEEAGVPRKCERRSCVVLHPQHLQIHFAVKLKLALELLREERWWFWLSW